MRTEPNNEWQTHWAKDWAGKHPNVNLGIEQINYADMAKKQLAELATGTMQDVVYSGIKWFPYSAAKGVFMSLDDLVKSNDPGMSDFIDAAIQGCKFEGKLYALPSELQTGNHTHIVYNKDMLQQKGVAFPTDDWNVQEFVDFATKLTDKNTKIFGTDYFPGTYYDLDALARTFGGEVLSTDAKKATFSSDPKAVEAAQWAYDLRAKYGVTPTRADSQATSGSLFPAGRLATTGVCICSLLSLGKTVGDKFKWDVALFPKSLDGQRGYEGFVVMWSVYSKSKQPETAFDLVNLQTSKEVGIWSVLNDGYQPSARK
ncbi:MAG: extracellular solute-binding protein, partial [Candidatus Dormibacteraceae bacterium]